jgi:hypothetical protein
MFDEDLTRDQRRLDLIQFWLSRTTESFDDWDYDGTELIICYNDDVIERYNNETLKTILNEFN